jgi:hypothetical protein
MLSNGRAAAPEPARDPRQDPDFNPQAQSKHLLRAIRSGALATLTAEGGPFATLTAVATHHDGSPVLLLSRLAAHTRNLERDPRCSLLLVQGGRGDPMAHPRLTLEAIAAKTNDKIARERFLRRNPKSALYADFPDFSFWRLEITGVHLNGGFARAADLRPDSLLTPLAGADSLLLAEGDVLDRLNADHADALSLLAQKLGDGEGPWRAAGLDPEGLDMTCGDRTSRAAFSERAKTPDEFHARFMELTS